MTPEEFYYTKEHEWIKLEDGVGTVGITDYAQSELGDIVFVELPEIGKQVAANDEVAVVESVKAASDIYAPVSGQVSEINPSLEDSPETVNKDPYGDGWFLRLKNVEESELSNLMTSADYAKYIESL